jgi:hypothetical protein
VLKKFGLGLAVFLVSFVMFTWWALESGGVAVVETSHIDGGLRQTHVWFIEDEGEIWLEAGTAGNGWYRDVLADPNLVLSVDGESSEWAAQPVDDDDRQRWLRAALRERYGVRDAWVGIFIDSTQTIPVRLEDRSGSLE